MEENQIIAEFMGIESDNAKMRGHLYECPVTAEYVTELEYHTSWDWLMPVVEKIESFQDGERGHLYNFRIEQHFVYVIDGDSMEHIIEMNGDSKLQATYKAIVEFINEYNKNN